MTLTHNWIEQIMKEKTAAKRGLLSFISCALMTVAYLRIFIRAVSWCCRIIFPTLVQLNVVVVKGARNREQKESDAVVNWCPQISKGFFFSSLARWLLTR